jgi:hypothetical protein
MHDDMQMIRQLQLEKCLQDGQIPCRWVPDLGNGYGYPLFNFYPPLPYIVGQSFRTLGFSFADSVKLATATQFVLASSFMFLLAASIFGNYAGLIAALFFNYAPYHALNVYVRGAMNEAWAAAFFPLIFYFSRKLILEKKTFDLVGLALSFCFLLLSHNPMALTFFPFLIIWCLFWILSKSKNITHIYDSFLKLAISGFLTLGLSAFFTLPVLLESKLVQIDTMFSNYYHFSVHFTSLYQLFISNFWGEGPSLWGPDDGMSFMIGYLHWIIPLLLFLLSLIMLIKTRKITQNLILFVIVFSSAFFTAFLTHERSNFLWQILTPIQKIQFPWRFLNLTAFFFSLSAAFIVVFLKNKLPQKIFFSILSLTIVLLLIINTGYFKPLTFGPISDDEKFSGQNWTRQVTASIYDYLPTTAPKAALDNPPQRFVADFNNPDNSLNISGLKKGTDWFLFNVNLSQESDLVLSQLSFPNFIIEDNGQPIGHNTDPEFGRMIINLSPGQHLIYGKLHDTPIRTISNYLSLAAWVFILSYYSKPLWKKLIFKK